MPAVPRVLLSPWAGRSSQTGAAPRAERKAVPQHCSAARLCTGRGSAPSFRGGWMEPGCQAAPQGSHPAPTGWHLCAIPRMLPCGMGREETERSGSMGLLISLEQSPPSSSGIISLKDTNQHKTASCSAPSATRGLGAGRPRLLVAFARQTWLQEDFSLCAA